MATKKISTEASIANTYKLSRGVASAAIPNAPTIGTATKVNDVSATVTYTAAVLGATASSFTALSSPGSLTGTGSSPITISGLTPETTYTFTVRATNANGNSAYSAASNSITTDPILDPGAMIPIGMVSVGSAGSANIEFTSIPSTYTHLQVRFIGRITRSELSDFPTFRFNNDTAANYSWHALEGQGVSAFAEASANSDTPRNGEITASTAGANIFGVGVVDILDYKNTSKYKTVRSLVGHDQNGSGTIWFGSSSWRNTNAITSIKITPAYGTGFVQYSQFALYGIKG